MGQAQAGEPAPGYRAFISYSHADDRFAGWLHRNLEHYRRAKQRPLQPIFIDRAELAAGPDLSAQVRSALAQSDALIVIASPAARASRWVALEIELYRQLRPDGQIVTALISGEPEAAFPEPLLHYNGETFEPLAADFRDGHDGKRLGLLKLIAGLTEQPLDQLVQRDSQSRQRRVMAVTALALLLVLVLSAALIISLRARAEAERQRAEAEGLVEFMLTDLRDRLIGVGRLDVMQTVNAQALGYYAKQQGLTDLPPDSLERRARVIEAMGEDDEAEGRLSDAHAKYLQLYRVSEALYQRDRTNPDRIYAYANGANRVALIETTQGQTLAALPKFTRAAELLNQLPRGVSKPQWGLLRSIVEGNLCAITIKTGGDLQQALTHCQAAVDSTRGLIAAEPNRLSYRYDLAFHYLWLGDTQDQLGNKAAAQEARRQSLSISQDLVEREPSNMRWREQQMEIALRLARLARESGDDTSFKSMLSKARTENAVLVRHDPANRYWSDYTGKIERLEKGESR